jgi:hypothetical protein
MGSDAVMYRVTPCGLRVSSIKKILLVQLGTHVPNVHAHVSKAPDIRAIMGLQDMWAGSIANTYMACRQTVIMQLQCSASTMDHSPGVIPGFYAKTEYSSYA